MPVIIDLHFPWIRCQDREVTRKVAVVFGAPRRDLVKAFEHHPLRLSRLFIISDVAGHSDVGQDVIKVIQGRDLRHRFTRPRRGDA